MCACYNISTLGDKVLGIIVERMITFNFIHSTGELNNSPRLGYELIYEV